MLLHLISCWLRNRLMLTILSSPLVLFLHEAEVVSVADVLLVRFLQVTVRKGIIRVEKVLLISQAQKAFNDSQCSIYRSLASPFSSEMACLGTFPIISEDFGLSRHIE